MEPFPCKTYVHIKQNRNVPDNSPTIISPEKVYVICEKIPFLQKFLNYTNLKWKSPSNVCINLFPLSTIIIIFICLISFIINISNEDGVKLLAIKEDPALIFMSTDNQKNLTEKVMLL